MKRLSKAQRRPAESEIGLAKAVAREFRHIAPNLDIDDLESEAMLGLVEAAKAWRSSGIAFRSFGANVMRQRLRRLIAEAPMVHAPERTVGRWRGRFRRARRLWEAEHDGRTLERDDLPAFCEQHGIPERAAFELLFEPAIAPLAESERRGS